MRWFLIVFGFLAVAWLGSLAVAQSPTQAPKTVNGYLVVAVCGTLGTPLVAGTYAAATIDVNGRTCVNQ